MSLDQAWHLAGFAHECARKAFIHTPRNSWVSKMLGHDFDSSGDLVMGVAVALDPRAGRFPVSEWAKRYPAIAAWHPNQRYDRTGAVQRVSHRRVAELVMQAREAVDACIVALFMDGALAIESVR